MKGTPGLKVFGRRINYATLKRLGFYDSFVTHLLRYFGKISSYFLVSIGSETAYDIFYDNMVSN